MNRFFRKTKGAISVFLVLVLLPVLLFGGLTTDAARIYSSKVVISDAGEMAMNAALAQYSESLLDEYGLLVMDSDPSSYKDEIERFFVESLNGNNLPGEEEYSQLLDLVSEDIHAFAVKGSEIYRTEVERQQIVEYMKYRAPLCLVDLVLEKLDAMKDTQEKMEVVKKEMEFSKASKKCQDAMEEAYDALKELETLNGDFSSYYLTSPGGIQGWLDETQMAYTTDLADMHIMIQAISRYEEAASGELEDMANSFIAEAGHVDTGNPASCFNDYLDCLYYQSGVASAGGIDKLLTDWLAENPEPEEEEDIPEDEKEAGSTETTRETEEHKAWTEAKEEVEELISDYKDAQDSIAPYPQKLRGKALELTENYANHIQGIYIYAGNCEAAAITAMDKLEAVRTEMEKAQGKWNEWNAKESAVYGSTEFSDEYAELFDEDKTDGYDELVTKVRTIKEYYHMMGDKLEVESSCGKALALEEAQAIYGAHNSKASDALSDVEITADFRPSDYRASFSGAYVHTDVTQLVWTGYTGDTFYEKLREYVGEGTKKEDAQKKEEANSQLNKGADAGKEAESDAGYPEFDWNSIENANAVLPSRVLNAATEDGGSQMTGVGGNVDDSENALQKFMDSIDAASSFLDGLDRILADTIVDLYVAEYTMQMFSYYTVDRNLDGSVKDAKSIITLSGYEMNADNRKAYKAEAEYILWGNTSSKKNVQYTVMTLFGIRLLFNSFFAFTDGVLRSSAQGIAHLAVGPLQFLAPIVQVLIQLGYAAIETGNDISKLKQGYGVTIIKDKQTWSTGLYAYNGDKANTEKVTLSYAEYMRIFLVLRMIVAGDKDILARIADCIQINKDYDLIKGYTMVSIDADVKSRTSFMRRISDMEGGSGLWSYADDYYTIHYQSILGY